MSAAAAPAVTPARPSLARLATFNLGFQFVWGAILALSLQARSTELGGSDGVRDYATIAAMGAAIGAVVQVVAGRLADRRRAAVGHRREFTTFGTLAAVPALLWFYLAPNFGQLIAAFALVEIAINVASGPYSAVIPDFVAPERRGLASSFMSAFQSLGNAAGLILVVAVTGLARAHVDAIVGAGLAAGLALTAVVTLAHVRTLRGIPVSASPAGVAPAARAAGFTGPLAALLISRGTINLGFSTLLDFLFFYVRDALGITGAQTQTQTGLVFLTFTFAGVAGAALAARPSDRYDKRLVVTVSLAAVVAALAVLTFATAFPVAVAAGALAGVGWGAFVTADWALAAIVLPSEEMGAAMGLWNVGTAVPQIVAPILTPLAVFPLVQRFGAAHAGIGMRGAIVLSLVEFAVGGALIWKLPRA